MDTICFHFLEKFLPIAVQEINSDIGPYDDDGEMKSHIVKPDYESERVLDEYTSLQIRQLKPS